MSCRMPWWPEARGLTTRAITLFALGGVAQIEKEPEDPKTEFWVGIVGPFSSAVIGLISLGLAWAGGLALQPRAADAAAGNAGMARLHQSHARGLQYDPWISFGRRANPARDYLVVHQERLRGPRN